MKKVKWYKRLRVKNVKRVKTYGEKLPLYAFFFVTLHRSCLKTDM